MPEDLYSATCNPPRRAKRSSADFLSSPSFTQPRAILPMRPYAPRPPTADETTYEPPPPPAKRGRKPGPLSRTAREAQRRLNHSIIEKARRTKINDALATLKELVPVGYGQVKPPSAESADADDEDEDDDDEYTEGAKKAKPKPKGTGKKEEKEKEFKLEILVRTVSFLQDLLKRVADLEATVSTPSACQNCIVSGPSEMPTKRKHIHLEDDVRDDDPVQEIARSATSRGAKAPRMSSESAPINAKIAQDVPISPTTLLISSTPVSPPPPTADAARLPSISSWLPNSVIDPQLLPSSNKPSSSPHMGSYLPSPPSSTHVDPVRTSHIPPVLSLGPVATAAMVNTPRSATSTTSSSSRTPEDESAASLLLQIRAGSSPKFRPVPSSPTSSSAYGLSDPSNFLLHSDVRSQREGNNAREAQTPGSMLGMKVNAVSTKKF